MMRVVDARHKFRPKGLEYTVQINVEVNMRFIIAIAKCLWQRKDLRITHTFNNNPFVDDGPTNP